MTLKRTFTSWWATHNGYFVKTMENLRKRSVVKFVSNPQQAETFAQRAIFTSFQIIRQDLVSVSFKTLDVVWTKPTTVGAANLDLSNLSLYKFHYEEMIPHYWLGQWKVAYKDTDFLLYLIEPTDLYKDMASFKHLLDLSDYPQNYLLHDPTNKKVLLTMTDELQGKSYAKLFVYEPNCLASITLVGWSRSPRAYKGQFKKLYVTICSDTAYCQKTELSEQWHSCVHTVIKL